MRETKTVVLVLRDVAAHEAQKIAEAMTSLTEGSVAFVTDEDEGETLAARATAKNEG